MSLSKLSEKCRKCSKMLTCDHKEMEAIGVLPLMKALEPITETEVHSLYEKIFQAVNSVNQICK